MFWWNRWLSKSVTALIAISFIQYLLIISPLNLNSDETKLRNLINSKFNIFCVCMKRITLCNCLCSSSPSSHFSASLIRNIGEFGTTNYFTDHLTANKIQLFVPIKRKFFRSILLQNKSQERGFP